jgi:selenocysteine-specific elongation factor
VALALAGVAVAELPRGEQLLGAGPWQATRRAAVALAPLPGVAVREGDAMWLHVLASRTIARVERVWPPEPAAGEPCRAVLRLARATFVAPGDRVIVRRASPARTLGGGEVLDPRPPPLRRRDAAALAELPDPGADLVRALSAWIAGGGAAGVDARDLAGRLGMTEAGIEAPRGRVLAAGEARVARAQPLRLVASVAVEAVAARARAALAAAGNIGVPMAELTSRVLPEGARPLREFYLAELRRAGAMQEVAGRALAAGLAPLADPLAAKLEALYREAGFAAPSPEEAAARLSANPRAVAGTIRVLLERRRLGRVGGKWLLHRELLDEVARSIREWGVESFDVAAFKERFALTRKLAIPLLEWLDSERITRREGERRRVLPASGRGPAG